MGTISPLQTKSHGSFHLQKGAFFYYPECLKSIVTISHKFGLVERPWITDATTELVIQLQICRRKTFLGVFYTFFYFLFFPSPFDLSLACCFLLMKWWSLASLATISGNNWKPTCRTEAGQHRYCLAVTCRSMSKMVLLSLHSCSFH